VADAKLDAALNRLAAFDRLNDTSTTYPRAHCLHEIFSDQARRQPTAIASVYGNYCTTYEELDRESDCVARYLDGIGARPGDVVGVSAKRSSSLLPAVLGILKVGGSYLPLDPEDPEDRLSYLVRDANCKFVVGSDHRLAFLAATGSTFVHLRAIDFAASSTVSRSVAWTDSSSLACVMYTSGTTGVPKGVAVRHFNVSRLVINTNYVDISPSDVFLQLAPLAFDASTFEIWGALLNGARVVLYDAPRVDFGKLRTLVADHQVSILWLSAGLFNAIADSAMDVFTPIRQLLVGGDVLSVAHINKVMNAHPQCQIVNGYGPTECTTFSVCCRIKRSDLVDRAIPIGRPVSNTQAYVLDADLQPAPIGQEGELFIGGDGLAQGYVGAEDLTRRKFVNVLLAGQKQRLYRTGDLALLAADGQLYFRGRVDRQLKVRGYRVEPAEVEAALMTCPGVTRVLVTADADSHGDKRLVAYLVCDSGRTPGPDELSTLVGRMVPPFMVPSAFVYLDEIPLLRNGKTDHRRLPSPTWQPRHARRGNVARTPIEKEVESIWMQVLGCKGVEMTTTIGDVRGDARQLATILRRLTKRFHVTFEGLSEKWRATAPATLVNYVRARSSTKGEMA
jgi:amino acid adenylation domain-containing protein